jgi:hypothetical protein
MANEKKRAPSRYSRHKTSARACLFPTSLYPLLRPLPLLLPGSLASPASDNRLHPIHRTGQSFGLWLGELDGGVGGDVVQGLRKVAQGVLAAAGQDDGGVGTVFGLDRLPVLSVLNTVSTMALKPLYLSSVGQSYFGAAKLGEDFANDVSLETADNLTVALPLLFTFADIGKRWWIVSHPNDGDAI